MSKFYLAHHNRTLHQWAISALGARSWVLDLGTGRHFGAKGDQSVRYGVRDSSLRAGLELNYVSLDSRLEARPDVVSSGLSIPFKDEYFGIVFAESMLQHVSPSEDVAGVVDEIHRVLATGGILVGWNPSCFHTTSHPKAFPDLNRWTYDGLLSLLRMFPELEIEACGGPLSVALDGPLVARSQATASGGIVGDAISIPVAPEPGS